MKPTQSLARRIRRLALTTKQANKGYYKGTGSGSMGEHTKHGGYVVDWEKVRTYVVPQNLKDFPLSPFVARTITPVRGQFPTIHGAFDPNLYLQRWKEENGKEWIPGPNRDEDGNYIPEEELFAQAEAEEAPDASKTR